MSAKAMRGAIETWCEMYRKYHELQNLAMEMFAHPDATDEQKLEVANGLGRVRNVLENSRRQIITHKEYRWPVAGQLERMKL